MDAALILLLAALPTAIFYGVSIGLLAAGLRRLKVAKFRLPLSAIIVAVAAYVAPWWGNAVTAGREDEQLARRVYPPRKVALRGDIRLETVEYTASMSPIEELPQGPWPSPSGGTAPRNGDYAHATGCGRVCLILLNTPGVESVTVESPSVRPLAAGPSPYAATYRLVPPGRCSTRIGSDQIPAVLRWSEEELQRFAKSRGQGDRCLSGEHPIQRFDFLIRGTTTLVPAESGRTGAGAVERDLGPRPVHLWMLEIHDGQRAVLLREVGVSGRKVFQPLLPMINLHRHGPLVAFYAPEMSHGRSAGWLVTHSLQRYTNAAFPPSP